MLSGDVVVGRGVAKAAKAAGLTVALATDRPEGTPAAIVVDLEGPGAMDTVAELRAANPDAVIAGYLAFPDKDRWIEAERAGCDLVANRGGLGKQLGLRLSSRDGGRRRFPLIDEADVSGRLGFITAVDETPFGPVAVYQSQGQVTVIDDVCPHAGERLSSGLVEGCVVTCPRHGSQFDVQTGDRLRGPSDAEVHSHETIRENGRVQLIWSD